MADSHDLSYSSFGFETKAIHAGQAPDPTSGAVIIPISLATTFQQASPGVHTGYEYSRSGNPTRHAFESCVASLENGAWGLAFGSGSAALASLTNIFEPGDEIICMDDVYGGTFRFFSKVAAPHGVNMKYIDMSVPAHLEAAMTPKTKLVWLETPTNPNLKIADIRAIAKITQHHGGAILAVDNTFMSPYLQKPLDLGADLVVHSVSKYLNGHSDVIMGIIVGKDFELHRRIKFVQNSMGAIPSPFDCWLALRGIKTLHIRMRQHCENAMLVAKYLEKHPKVERIMFPGLESHPQHELAKKQQSGFGGMITFWLTGGIIESRKFLENLKLFALAESLGGVESLIEHPAIMTHASIPEAEREKLGISSNMVRISVGIETGEDLIKDLESGLSHV